MKIWAVLVTYRRSYSLRSVLTAISEQTSPPDHLVLVDNGSDPEVECLAAEFGAEYLDAGENLGPAGGIALGMVSVLRSAQDEDFILILDDDDAPKSRFDVERMRDFALRQCASVDRTWAVGLVGSRFRRDRGRLERVRDEELHGPVCVDMIGSGHLPLYRVKAVRAIGVFNGELFFGFDDLEYGLRIQAGGGLLFADGEAWLERRRLDGRLELAVPRHFRTSTVAIWRRYYSLRNIIYISRTYGTFLAPLFPTARGLLGGGFRDLVLDHDAHVVWVCIRAAIDGWSGRMGRRVDAGNGAKTKLVIRAANEDGISGHSP